MSEKACTTNYPVLVGITGGLGSGKTTVCRMLARMGCGVFEADRVAKNLQVEDPEVIEGIKRIFGEDVYSSSRSGKLSLDRHRIAREIFKDSCMRNRINELIHPKVFRAFQEAVEHAARDGVKVVVKEAAILLESGSDKGLDIVVVVVSDLEKRIERAMKKGMGSREEIMRRIEAQWPQEKLVERADYVIENNGSVGELENSVRALYQKIFA
ncbi:MAG: dephospho-CoA kinase [Chlorobiales bacterium]|nr:dephospho-CoA kinase [Chlorobiales bacterium]